jgi:2-oxoglutarate dehydrogenase E2 component (dihydrolipoamide succinyltransferase)
MADVIMPQMGESIAEGTVTKWLKNVGDRVERDEPLFEISTDKVDAEIPSPAAGVLKEIRVAPGTTVPINTVVAIVAAEAGAAVAALCPSRLPPRLPRPPPRLRHLVLPLLLPLHPGPLPAPRGPAGVAKAAPAGGPIADDPPPRPEEKQAPT